MKYLEPKILVECMQIVEKLYIQSLLSFDHVIEEEITARKADNRLVDNLKIPLLEKSLLVELEPKGDAMSVKSPKPGEGEEERFSNVPIYDVNKDGDQEEDED